MDMQLVREVVAELGSWVVLALLVVFGYAGVLFTLWRLDRRWTEEVKAAVCIPVNGPSRGPRGINVTRLSQADRALVMAKSELCRARDRVHQAELALFEIPFWRVFEGARQRRRLLDAKVALRVAENAVVEAARARDAAMGVA